MTKLLFERADAERDRISKTSLSAKPPTVPLLICLLLLFGGASTPATGASFNERLEGYTLDPHEGWTTGAVKGWSEGGCIPFRYSVENKGRSPETLDLELVFDTERDGTRGIVRFESFVVPAGSIYGPYFDGDEGRYRWIVTVPRSTTYVLEWCARLSDEVGLWPGASLHVSAKDGGSRDVPIMTKDLLVPDLTARSTAIAECGHIIYSIRYSNVGSADQRNVTLVDDYDETKVAVTDDGGGADDGDAITWDLGDLPRRGEGNVSYTVRLKDGVDDDAMIVSSGFIAGDLSEKITENNRYLIQVVAKFGPKADAGPDKSITLGDSVVIGGSPAATSVSGGYTYRWDPAEGLDDPAKPNPVASPVGSANYTLTVIDESGCAESDEVRVTVTEPILCGISGPYSVCDDQPIATFYYVGEDLLASSASFEFTWKVDGMVVGSGEEMTVEWSRFEFGRHDLDLEIVKENPDGTIATGGCKLEVLYVESPTASIIML